MPHPTFVVDQVVATANDLAARLAASRIPGTPVETHPAELVLAQTLSDHLSRGALGLCVHLAHTSPGDLVWVPGLADLGCRVEMSERWAELSQQCAMCGEPSNGAGGMVATVGPVAVFGALCSSCRDTPASADLSDEDAAALDEARMAVAAAVVGLWMAAA